MRLFRNYRYKKLEVVKPQLNVRREAYEFIVKTTKDSPQVETGGILIGSDIKPLTVNVTHASLPGPKAYHSSTKFLRDTGYCSKVLREHYEKYGVDYVGEWHSHIVPLRGVSGGDIATLSSIMYDSDYRFNAFACIVAFLENDKVELLGYITTKRYIYQVEIQVIDTIKYLER
ncbi:hypothetical protein [Lutispora saccharofermentans]|uniref:JAB domain-containing protein n=1 Tax=Lutispora saccharofermentans TaxID=3024236 RepID=A0ABT1NE48_9FIRM|nr:hypothetical protein [Lutispora saccharofermentans]MCQ1529513.1 hypothetical protein [Lutispora saccharofermentans]